MEQNQTIDHKNYIKMPLLTCDNAIVWISKASKEDIDLLIDKLNQYFNQLFFNSKIEKFDSDIWVNKINELESKIIDQDLINILTYFKDIKFNHNFYYGDYHGDLTLSNLFISNDDNQVNNDFEFRQQIDKYFWQCRRP